MSRIYNPRFVAGPVHPRKSQDRGVDWISGYYPSGKAAMNFRLVRYDGMLSHDLILKLESDSAVISYWEKPATVRWSDGLRWKTYRPDYKVDLVDGRSICVEVMPLAKVAKTGFLHRLPHIRRYCLRAGYADFELWTEQELSIQPRLANDALLGSARTFVTDDAVTLRVRVLIRERGGRATIRDLRRESGLGRRSFRAVIRLVATGELCAVNPNQPLDDNATVEISKD